MAEDNVERRMLILMVLLALWAAAWGYSMVELLTTLDITAATAPTLSRSVGFLGWQGVAGMIAFGCWGVGWSMPKGSAIRRISTVPVWFALGFVVLMVGIVMFRE